MTQPSASPETRIGPLGIAALAGSAGVALVVLWGAWRLVAAALMATGAGGQMEEADARGPDLAIAQSRIDGRSLFFIPGPPPPPPQPPPPPDGDPPPPPPDPKPTRYGGPEIVALVNDTVWLEGGETLGLEESADGVTVLAVNAPWSARLLWREVEFDVSLFGRDEVVYPDGVRFHGQEAAPSPGETELGEAAAQNGAEPQADEPDEPDDRAAGGQGEEVEGTGR
ncbi:MAG: hypothetical protein ACF8R7_10360 [Phycisphaerales bacterium JB039]